MKFNYDCLHCHINQGIKVADYLGLDSKTKENIVKKTMTSLGDADFNKQNPELMTSTWEVITSISNNEDPYKNFKSHYNNIILAIEHQLKTLLDNQMSPFNSYLYTAILGNIIDLGPSHTFEADNWYKLFEDELKHIDLAINHSGALFTTLRTAKNLLYIGDNCGEIVLDKLFVSYIKTIFPNLSITFSVRDKPILNDATLIDAKQIGLDHVVHTISNGENTPGLILTKTSDEFKQHFDLADVIIAKGQGNYEGLSDIHDSRIFHLFMVKCPLIALETGVTNMSKICYRQKEQ